jgi:membrane-bound lytic murein transglycosylase MltF
MASDETRARLLAGITLLFAATAAACNRQAPEPSSAPPPQTAPAPQAPATQPPEDPLPPSELETELPEAVRAALWKPFTGDFDEMVAHGFVRVGVTFNRTFYFVDKGAQRGVAYEYGRLMEDRINTKLGRRKTKVHVLFVPLPRDKLLPALIEGRVDMVASQLTITPEREKLVDFSDPTRTNVREILVTAPGTPGVTGLNDLAGRRVFIRKTSSYYQSLLGLNKTLQSSGKEPVLIEAAPENLNDDDLLEMVNAELIPAVIVHDYVAKFWKKVFPNIVVNEHVSVRSGGRLGIAIRQNSPQLKAALNRFMGKYGLGSAFGNQIQRKYLINTKYAKNAASERERQKFLAVVQLFRKYGDQYRVDFLLMAAQGYQESRLNQSARSPVGAIGIMQLMPATGKEQNVGDITQLEPNIHAGVKYMRSIADANFKDEPMDALNRGLFTFASYNAGPRRVRQLRQEAQKRGLDPNVWFGSVEQVASERIGRETVAYVSNIYKYYVAYRLVVEENERRAAAKASLREVRP